MDGAEVVAHVAELARAVEARVVGFVDGFGGPDADMAIAAGGREALAIGGDMAAVDLEVLVFAWESGLAVWIRPDDRLGS